MGMWNSDWTPPSGTTTRKGCIPLWFIMMIGAVLFITAAILINHLHLYR